MDKKQIDTIMAKAVMAKLEKAKELGIKASWTMQDQLNAATLVLCETVKDGVEPQEVKEAIQATYNHSAFAQKLQKKFEATGHFQRSAKVGKETETDDLLANLAKEIAAQEKVEAAPESAPEAAEQG